MSQSDSPALGSRENFWGDDPAATPDQRDASDADDAADGLPTIHEMLDRNQFEASGVGWAEYVAYALLRPATVVLCPDCGATWDDADPDVYPTLSKPTVYVPPSEVEVEDDLTITYYADHRRHRYCTRCGTVSWGGILADLPTEEFLTVVNLFLASLDRLPPRQAEQLFDDAHSRKLRGWCDVENVEALLRDYRTPESTEA